MDRATPDIIKLRQGWGSDLHLSMPSSCSSPSPSWSPLQSPSPPTSPLSLSSPSLQALVREPGLWFTPSLPGAAAWQCCEQTPPGAHSAHRRIKGGLAREGGGSSPIASVSYRELSRYFTMPINKAAKEMKVGLTVLKKRCRELGIPRWPQRKLKSLDSLIAFIQESSEGEQVGIGRNSNLFTNPINTVTELINQKKMMEDMPGSELCELTKRIRQICFKATYRKRRKHQHKRHFSPPVITWSSSSSSAAPKASAMVMMVMPPLHFFAPTLWQHHLDRPSLSMELPSTKMFVVNSYPNPLHSLSPRPLLC